MLHFGKLASKMRDVGINPAREGIIIGGDESNLHNLYRPFRFTYLDGSFR
jgi:hypothetical protein